MQYEKILAEQWLISFGKEMDQKDLNSDIYIERKF